MSAYYGPYSNIVKGPDRWALVIAAVQRDDKGRRQMVPFYFSQATRRGQIEHRCEIILIGPRRKAVFDVFLRIEGLREICHYTYDTRNRSGLLSKVHNEESFILSETRN